MRTLLNIVFFTVVLIGCSKKTDSGLVPKNVRVDLQDVELREGLTYLKSSGELLTGTLEELWPNGQKKQMVEYRAGKIHGQASSWYLSGQMKSKGQWIDGRREGSRFIYSEDGLEQYEETYREGVLVAQKGSASAKLKAQIQEAASNREAMDKDVWKDEVTSQEYESTIVHLWDDLRAVKHDWKPLHDFIFNDLQVGSPGKISKHQHSVEQVIFGEPNKMLDRNQWQAQLAQWREGGYRLVETEWHQEVFEPASKGQGTGPGAEIVDVSTYTG